MRIKPQHLKKKNKVPFSISQFSKKKEFLSGFLLKKIFRRKLPF